VGAQATIPSRQGAGQCSKNSSEPQKSDVRSCQFFKIRKIRSKCTGDDGETVKPGTPINRTGFSENWHGDFRAVCAGNGQFLSKIGKWNEKIIKNNDITSNKFVHTNNP
jgi:hypothetical protein